MISLSGFTPDELGLPVKFRSFRPVQVEAIEFAANSEKRFVGECLSTGAGKTVVAGGIAKVMGVRAVVLTSTKGLQEQYSNTFRDIGMVDIRGKANYSCTDLRHLSCRFGPHEGCRRTGGCGCTYEQAVMQAKQADLVVTNYAYWIAANEAMKKNVFGPGTRPLELTPKEGGPNPIDLLICDEGHSIDSALSNALSVSIRESWLHQMKLPYEKRDDLGYWVDWSQRTHPVVEEMLAEEIKHLKRKGLRDTRDRVYVLEELKEATERIVGMSEEGWVCEMALGTRYGRLWSFDCVWPGAYAESRLFAGVKKVVLMSATLRPAAMRMLGLKADSYEFREWPRIFPANRSPFYYVPKVKLSYASTETELDTLVDAVDDFIASRLDRKGIIHTGSYQRQQYLLRKSRFARHMVCNTSDPESESAQEVAERFKAMGTPGVLVSPSFSTGWDFPGEECEWQVILKVPFPDTRTKVMQERCKRDSQYSAYIAMQDLVQAKGRGCRYEQDRCETVCFDSQLGWFTRRFRHLAPMGWVEEIIELVDAPKPGPRVQPLTKAA